MKNGRSLNKEKEEEEESGSEMKEKDYPASEGLIPIAPLFLLFLNFLLIFYSVFFLSTSGRASGFGSRSRAFFSSLSVGVG